MRHAREEAEGERPGQSRYRQENNFPVGTVIKSQQGEHAGGADGQVVGTAWVQCRINVCDVDPTLNQRSGRG